MGYEFLKRGHPDVNALLREAIDRDGKLQGLDGVGLQFGPDGFGMGFIMLGTLSRLRAFIAV